MRKKRRPKFHPGPLSRIVNLCGNERVVVYRPSNDPLKEATTLISFYKCVDLECMENIRKAFVEVLNTEGAQLKMWECNTHNSGNPVVTFHFDIGKIYLALRQTDATFLNLLV